MHYMKLYFIFLFSIFSTHAVFSQTLIVSDQVTGERIQYAGVHCSESNITLTTDKNGETNLTSINGCESIFIQAPGYKRLTLSYQDLQLSDFNIILSEKIFQLDEMVVSANRDEEIRSNLVQEIKIINNKELAFSNQQTSADVLQNSGNVLVQKSQQGGGSPIIRGFETNKVLLVVDGVRMNNAIYRGGHLQNVITLDNAIMDRVEVVFGPGSVMYGSDALGGVMHFVTRKPEISRDDSTLYFKGNAFTRYSSSSNAKTAHIDINLGWRKFASLTSVTTSDFGDLRQGNWRNPRYGDWGKSTFYVDRINGVDSIFTNNNVNIQTNSGYKQIDGLQKFILYHSKREVSTVNIQYSTSGNVNRYDRLSQLTGETPKFSEWYYGPQKRLLTSYTFKSENKKKYRDHIQIVTAYQNIEESRHNRKFESDNINRRTESLDIFSLNLDLSKKIKSNTIRYGFEGLYNTVKSSAFQENINSGEKGNLDTRYPDGGSTVESFSAYITHSKKSKNEKFIYSNGIRFNRTQLESKFIDKTFFPFLNNIVNQNNNAVTGNLGILYKADSSWRLSVLASSGYRAPNVDDLSKVFESVQGTVIIPNPNLKPEFTYNLDLGLAKTYKDKVTIGGTVYYTIYRNAITVQPGQFNGSDSIEFENELSQVVMNENALKAFIYGGNAYVLADLSRHWSFSSNINYTYGRIKETDSLRPLDHIPPLFGKTSVIFKAKKIKGELFAMYNGWKRKKDYNLLGEDNFSTATPDGMPAWFTLNFRSSYQVNKNLQAQLAIDNILDRNYRVFASGISASGRNISATLRANF